MVLPSKECCQDRGEGSRGAVARAACLWRIELSSPNVHLLVCSKFPTLSSPASMVRTGLSYWCVSVLQDRYSSDKKAQESKRNGVIHQPERPGELLGGQQCLPCPQRLALHSSSSKQKMKPGSAARQTPAAAVLRAAALGRGGRGRALSSFEAGKLRFGTGQVPRLWSPGSALPVAASRPFSLGVQWASCCSQGCPQC